MQHLISVVITLILLQQFFFSAINFFFLVVNYLCKRWDTNCETWEELIKCVNHHFNIIFQGSNNGQGGGQGAGGGAILAKGVAMVGVATVNG